MLALLIRLCVSRRAVWRRGAARRSLDEAQVNVWREGDAVTVGKLVLVDAPNANMQPVGAMQIGDPPGAVNPAKLGMLAGYLPIGERYIVI